MASYSVVIKPSAVKELEALPDRPERRRIVERIRALADDPRPASTTRLTGSDKYRIRQGAVRIVYEVDDRARLVRVVRIARRDVVYRPRRD